MKWHDIQEEINNCHECKPALAMITKPVRPPEPQKGDILFMSEAPPPDGGFWEEKTNDALRRNIGSIVTPELANANLMLQKFRDQRLTLVQTLKWPFLETSIAEIRHSALRHIFQEISFINPREIIALGKVAGRALQVLYPKSDFATKFRQLKTIDTLRRGEYNADGLAIRITYLPVDRMWNQYADEIRPDILRFIGDAGKVNNQMN